MLHNLTREEAGRRSALLTVDSYTVSLDLTGHDLSGVPVDQPETTFVSRTVVRFAAQESADIHIDLIAEKVISAALNGDDLDPASYDGSRLPLHTAEGDNELIVLALCRYSRSGEGLHRFVDPADQRTYLYTQFEASEARRVYACFEQPDLKATFELTVLAPEGWTVIANSVGDEPVPVEGLDGVTSRHFPATPRVSTYLTSVVAGEYAVVTDRHTTKSGELPMSILVRQSLLEYLDADRIFATTKAGFDIFEKHFAYAYPFGKYDQAFVPEYNMGAMENIGCVTLRDDLVFRSRVTEANYRTRDETILHELAHMWFGDLVTMVWWDDMWLKESFAEFSATFAVAERTGEPEAAWATFTGSRKNWAYRQDQLPTTHPIAADMVDLEAVESNFDGITYAKGASVLRQLVAFVGQDAFLEGARGYFTEHAFGNTRLTDLLKALEGPSGRDLSGWSAEWLETAGVNTLRPRFETDDSGAFTSFTVEQTAPDDHPTLRHHRIAIGLYSLPDDDNSLQSRELVRTDRVETDIAGASTEITELIGKQRPDLVLVNDDDLSYAKIRFDDRSMQTLINNLSAIKSPLSRALCWGAAWDLCRDAETAAADYAELVLRNVANETDLTTVRAVLMNAALAVRSYTPPAERPQAVARWEQGLAELVAAAEAGSDHQLGLAQAYARSVTSSDGVEVLSGWLEGRDVPEGLVIDAELRWLLIIELARCGAVDDAAIASELERDNTDSGAESAAAARSARPTAEAKAHAWALAVEGNDVPNETQRQICESFWQPGQDEVLEGYLDKYLKAAEEISTSTGIWAQKSSIFRQNVLTYLFPDIADDAAKIGRLQGWLAAGVTEAGAPLGDMVKHIVAERLDGADRAHRCQGVTRL